MSADPAGQPLRPRKASSATAKRRSRRVLPLLGAVIVIGLIVAGLWPQPVPVETATASVGKLRVTVNEEGKTRVKQKYLVSAPVTGQLRRIPFKAGAQVNAGETVIAVIDPLPPTLLDARSLSLAEARRDTASANLGRAASVNEFAANEFRRFENLFREGAVSVQEREAAQMRAESAARELAAAESALRQAEAELAVFDSPAPESRSAVEVTSPASGRILRVFEESARVVTPGTPLVEIGDPRNLEVVIDVLSRDGAAIQPGTQVELGQWGGGRPFERRRPPG